MMRHLEVTLGSLGEFETCPDWGATLEKGILKWFDAGTDHAAQRQAMAIRPEAGGFPYLAEALRAKATAPGSRTVDAVTLFTSGGIRACLLLASGESAPLSAHKASFPNGTFHWERSAKFSEKCHRHLQWQPDPASRC
jgi:hypothetical protein